MVTLRVIVDEAKEAELDERGRYAIGLTRALIDTAPRGCDVVAVIARSSGEDADRVRERIPGLADVSTALLGRKELGFAWQHGVPVSTEHGMIHSTSLLAPLRSHENSLDPTQVVVTVHDALPWTHPETLDAKTVRFAKAMMARAERFADAIVVPTHSVAETLAENYDLGTRLRVIASAPRPGFEVPGDAAQRVAELGIDGRFIATSATPDDHHGLAPLLEAMRSHLLDGISLVITSTRPADVTEWDAAIAASGISPERVRFVPDESAQTVAAVVSQAALFVVPSYDDGFSLPLVEAMSVGTPVVHSDAPSLAEITQDAGVSVPVDVSNEETGEIELPAAHSEANSAAALTDAPTSAAAEVEVESARDECGTDAAERAEGSSQPAAKEKRAPLSNAYAKRLAHAISSVLSDDGKRERLSVQSLDRARAFTWRDAAERVWQLHADL